jgi:thioredoxin-dependent peroxiredoxin
MKPGDVVDDFELPDQDGKSRRLTELLSAGPVVLFFYPAAMTSGCTKESCHFRDLKAEFEALGAQRVGISADRVEKQRAFSDKHSFDYPLLSDPERKVAVAMGVKRGLSFLPNKRATFVIDTDRTVLGVVKSETRMDQHADDALEILRQRSASASS